MKIRHRFSLYPCLPTAALAALLILPAASAQIPHKEAAALGVSLNVIDPCLNSRNLQAPQCADRMPSKTTEKAEFFQIRDDKGMVVEELPGRDFILRTVDFY